MNVDTLTARAAEFVQKHGRPLVTLSYAQSLDGCITVTRGHPTTLSSPEAATFTHRVRAVHDAILIGIGTLLVDKPRLTVRLVEGQNPQPVVLDTRLRFPSDSQLHRPWIFSGPDSDSQKNLAVRNHLARVFRVPVDSTHRLDLSSVLHELARQGITSLMVEGGASVITSFLQARLVDQVAITIAPVWLGGVNAIQAPLTTHRLRNLRYEPTGDDIIICASVDYR